MDMPLLGIPKAKKYNQIKIIIMGGEYILTNSEIFDIDYFFSIVNKTYIDYFLH